MTVLLRARRTRYDSLMLRLRSLACLLAALCSSSPLVAQTKKDAKKAEKKDAAEAKPEQPKAEEDVVIDNRGLAKKKALEEEQKEDAMFENDTPFASTVPDPVALRQQRWQPGFGGGFRLGFAFPMGDIAGNIKLSEATDGLVFLGGEFGYWPIPHLFFGLGLTGGYVVPDCENEDATCSGWQLRGGPVVMARLQPFSNLSPFAGIGTGYEWMTLSSSTDASSRRTNYHGFEYVNVQAGLDVKSRGDFYGVFVSWSLGKFTKYSTSRESSVLGNSEDSGDIDEPRTHSWLGIGARGTLE